MDSIVNEKAISFKELEEKIFKKVCLLGCIWIKEILEEYDDELMETRDRNAYRNKGKRKTTVKTLCGEVEYSRRIYETVTDNGEKVLVYLLDEAIGMDKIGQISSNLAEKIAKAATEESFRKAATQISETTGQSISHGGAWGIIQKLGQRINEEEEHEIEKMNAGQATGQKEIPVLFEEMDSTYVKSQEGSDHKKGSNIEIKVFTMYEGWSAGENGKPINKKVMAGVEDARAFHKRREAYIESVYDVDEIQQRVLNGDGGMWIKEPYDLDAITQLDLFHIEEAITKGIADAHYARKVRNSINAQKIDEAFETIEIYANSVANNDKEDKREANALNLLKYLRNNRKGLIPWKKQIIPPKAPIGISYEKNMGVQESTNCSVITLRMKHRRARWSDAGATNMVKILSRKSNGELVKTVDSFCDGFLPIRYAEEITEPLSAARTPKKDGKGSYYLDYLNASIPLADSKMTYSRKEFMRSLGVL